MIFKSALVLQILTVILFGSVYAQEKKTDPNTIEHKIHLGDILLNGSLVNDDQGNQSIELTLLCGTADPNKLEKLRIGITGVDPEKRVAGESTDLKLIGANQKGELFFFLSNPKVVIIYGNDNKMSVVVELDKELSNKSGKSEILLPGSNPSVFNRFIVNYNGDLLFAAKDKRLLRISKEGLDEVFRFPGSHTIICSIPATICVDSKNRAYAYAIDNNTYQYGLYLFEKDKKPELLKEVNTTIPKYVNQGRETEWAKRVADRELSDFFVSNPEGFVGGSQVQAYTMLMADTMAFTLDQSDNLVIPSKATATVKDEDGDDIETKVPAIIRIDSEGKVSPLWIAKNNFLFHPFLIELKGDHLMWNVFPTLLVRQKENIYVVEFIRKYNYEPTSRMVVPFHGDIRRAGQNVDPDGECERAPALWFQLMPVERSIKIVELIGEKQKPKFGNLEVEAK
jgi:hypothetical protein